MTDELQAVPVRGANFWVRSAAHLLVDLPILMFLTVPLTLVIMVRVYGLDSVITPGAVQIPWWWNVVFNVAIIGVLMARWENCQATPGKQVFHLKIVRLADGGVPTRWQWMVRAVAYIISSLPIIPVPIEMMGLRETLWLPLGLGFLWILFDSRNRGWHDILSGTITVACPEEATPQ
jgi:uncharacterized RDD family membrane protein YckC